MATKVKKRLDVFLIPTDKQIAKQVKEKWYLEGGWDINNAPPYEEGMKWFRDIILKKKYDVLPKLFLHQYVVDSAEARDIPVWKLDAFFKGAEDMKNMIFNKKK